jgi:hypothetical protein
VLCTNQVTRLKEVRVGLTVYYPLDSNIITQIRKFSDEELSLFIRKDSSYYHWDRDAKWVKIGYRWLYCLSMDKSLGAQQERIFLLDQHAEHGLGNWDNRQIDVSMLWIKLAKIRVC